MANDKELTQGVSESKVTARLEFEKKYNLGNYEHESLKIIIEGPYNDIRDGKDLPRLLLPTWRNMVTLTEKVRERATPEDIALQKANTQKPVIPEKVVKAPGVKVADEDDI
jgi:hypothetical protein